MAQHRAFGRARGAGGVDEDREVVRLREVHELVVGRFGLALVPGAQLEQRVEGHHLVVAEIVQAVHVVHDDLHEPAAPVAHLEDLVELLLVLGEEEARAAVVDDVLHLAGGVRRVDAVGDAADRHGAEVGVEPLGAVVREDRHDVFRPEPEGDEPEPDVPGALAVLAPGDGAPQPEVLLPHRDLIAALGHDVAEQLRQRVLPVDRAAHRHVFFLFQRRVPRTLDSFTPR